MGVKARLCGVALFPTSIAPPEQSRCGMALIKLSRAHMASFELGSSVGCLASEGLDYCLGEPHMASELSTHPAGTS